MNHKSLIGLLRAVLKISPAVSMPNCLVNLDVMRMLARLELHNKFKTEVSIMKGHFDATLGKSLASFKSHGQSAKLWWDVVHDFAGLVLPIEATTKCMECSISWDSVSAELALVVQSSDAGAKIFGSVWKQLQSEKIRVLISSTITGFDGQNLTAQFLNTKKNDCIICSIPSSSLGFCFLRH